MPDISERFPSTGEPFVATPLKTKHMDFLLSPKAKKGSAALPRFLRQVVPDCINIPVDQFMGLLQGDQDLVLTAIYRATFGDKLPFKSSCEDCDYTDDYEVDLKEIEVRRFGDKECRPSIYQFQGTEIRWHLATIGEVLDSMEDAEAQSIKAGGETGFAITFTTAAFIDDIVGLTDQPMTDGRDIGPKTKKRAIQRWVSEASFDFVTAFMAMVDDFSCGPDASVEIDCPKCGKTYREDVPILGSFFTAAQRAKRKKNVKSPRLVRFSTSSATSSPSPRFPQDSLGSPSPT